MAIVGDCYEYVDRRFYDLTVPIAEVEQLYDGCRWAEGPVWFNDGGYLLWSDIPNQRLMRWVPDVGVSVYRSQTNYINGNTRDRQGRLVNNVRAPLQRLMQSRRSSLSVSQSRLTQARNAPRKSPDYEPSPSPSMETRLPLN